jgi:hypothetical protein
VLAGATYPEQITAANQWLAQNPALKGDALQKCRSRAAVGRQREVADRLPWRTEPDGWQSPMDQVAGGYVNDPNDVMNAIQAMRLRAQQAGNLKNSPQLRVSTTVRQAPPPDYAPSAAEPLAYAGPAVIPPPPQTIVIEPAQPDGVRAAIQSHGRHMNRWRFIRAGCGSSRLMPVKTW